MSHTDTVGERKNFYLKSAFLGSVTMPDGSNVRIAIASVIAKLQTKLFATAEDDTKSLNIIVNIWGSLMLNMIPSAEEYEAQTKALVLGKKVFENKMLGKKRHIRSIIINQAFHQHESILAYSSFLHTRTHVDIADHLFEMATSHYSEVRKNAQRMLLTSIRMYKDDLMLQPKIIEILKQDSNLYHERFKGALYVLLGPKEVSIITRRDWSLLKTLWPAVVRAQPSEKPSVINLLNAVSESVNKQFHTLTIETQMGNKGEEFARMLLESSVEVDRLPTAEEVAAAQDKLTKTNNSCKTDYLELLTSLCDCIDSNLHWRHHSLALGFLRDLVHPDCEYPPHVVRVILHTLIHDNIEFRKIAIKCTVYVLKQQKRTHKYRVREVDRSTTCISSGRLQYGHREDNQWLQYDSATVPKSPAAWDEPRYVHKPYVGYYAWDKEVKVNAPSSEQPPLDRTREEMSEGEREVDSFFSDSDKLKKLIDFLSLEEKKGKDKFNGMHFVLFKNLFRNHGDQYMELFKPHLERLIADKHESNQRCASEIISGLIRGAKHWPYDKVERMWEYLTPLLKTAFANMTVETVNDWSVMAATALENRDPNRHHWFLEFLMEDPLREEASFIDCGRLCALQGAINQQESRVAELFHRLLDYLTPKLSHPYQLLRERIGSVLTNIFALDLPTSGPRRTRGPLISQFVASIMPQLFCLYSLSDVTNSQLQLTSVNVESNTDSQMEVGIPNKFDVDINENGKNTAICLFKTMVKWMTNSIMRADYSSIPEFFAFLPLVCLMENYEADDEVNKVCTAMLAVMAQCLTLPEFLPTALTAINEVAEMSSWSARATCLDFLQVFVFHNMPTISSQEPWVSQDGPSLHLYPTSCFRVQPRLGKSAGLCSPQKFQSSFFIRKKKTEKSATTAWSTDRKLDTEFHPVCGPPVELV
ncbi:Proteasome activator complex subunit 4 [Homalodisca vitripennis]|nr:Proteasome activator complex subunit 4 [Homalodisca vitripennis]